MTPSGWQFAADLSELRTVGAVDLPALGFTYAKLNNAIDATTGHDTTAFQQRGSAGMDQVFAGWSALRDELQNIFGKTADNIHTTGAVILHIVEAYASTDAEARRSLDAAWQSGPPHLQDGEVVARTPPPVALK
jgi:hypothetical protein